MFNYLHIAGIVFLSIILLACGEVPKSRYRDTSQLERPPGLEIAAPASVDMPEKKSVVAKGLGDHVHLEFPLLTLDMPFDHAWQYLEDALIARRIKINDRNREEGKFFVHFNPNGRDQKKSGLKVILSLFTGAYEEGDYLLICKQKGQQTEITAALIEPEKDKLDDNEGDYDLPEDNSDQLLQTLFTALHDDVAVNQTSTP